jgi:ribosome biogenesis GTPase
VRGSVMGRETALGNAVVVGDRVHYELDGGHVMVSGVEPRRNVFCRRASGTRPIQQVVAANLDQIILVASIRHPEFRAGFADRVLCQAQHLGVPARIVITKIDLAATDQARALLADYARAGYPGHVVCAVTGEGLEPLRSECRGRRSLFVGHSGVGKSTLLNALVPGLDLLAAEVNIKTKKGRHTTSAAFLLRPEPGLDVIDTPGVRSFGLWGVDANDLEQTYAEFQAFRGQCRFSDCRHDREHGCAIRAGVQAGHIAERRYHSFLKLRAELEAESAR